MKIYYAFSFLLSLFLMSCTNVSQGPEDKSIFTETPEDFRSYWYQGKAEIASYSLTQSRYGELHEGHAVLVFVTEDFSKSKQVKLDAPDRHPQDAVPILKLNKSKKFLTGVYPYSMMTSVFTPIDVDIYPHSLKLTTTSQEWCGHTFTQLNLAQNSYEGQQYSYFESEGDETFEWPSAMLEDELFTRLRIDPSTIPLGEQQLIIDGMTARLMHVDLKPRKAQVSFEMAEDGHFEGEEARCLTVNYPDLKRELKIYVGTAFPYTILGWDETYPAPSWSAKPKQLTTRARLKKTLLSAYWAKNGNEDRGLRNVLELE